MIQPWDGPGLTMILPVVSILVMPWSLERRLQAA
jgi:hypothetical protein